MSKCDCYRVELEYRYFVDKYGAPIRESVNIPRCLGTKEKDACDCDGDRSKCSFYENVRAKAAEEEKSLSTTKNVLEEIEGLIGEYWGTDPIYYVDSKNKEEDGAAKLCCKILKAIRMSRGGIDGENS